MRGVGDITQETDWSGKIIGQVSSLSGEKFGKREREKGRYYVLPERGEMRVYYTINILWTRSDPDYTYCI